MQPGAIRNFFDISAFVDRSDEVSFIIKDHIAVDKSKLCHYYCCYGKHYYSS